MMESAETGTCLWMVASEQIYGIRMEKLEKLGKNDVTDWKSHLEPAPFDFSLDVPGAGWLCPFIFDSGLFFAGGPFDAYNNEIYQICYVGGDRLEASDAVETGAIPPPPTQIYESYIANIKGDVYLVVVVDDPLGKREAGLWVLRSGSRKWHSLSAPPTTRHSGCRPDWLVGSVREDKLILRPFAPSRGPFVYDPQTDRWDERERTSSIADYSSRRFAFVSTLRHAGNCSVVLTWDAITCPTDFVKYEIHALLVDNQNYCVRRHQCLDELSEALQPSFDGLSTDVNLVDLGNSKVCVIICGLAKEYIPVLCIVVVELGLLQEEEQRFLSVRVLGNQVYNMLPNKTNDGLFSFSNAFIFSLSKRMPRKHPHSQDCISPRKVLKPAGGTNPSNPTTGFEQE